MKTTEYYKSGDHLKNILSARELAAVASQKNKQARIDAYSLSPICCANCNTPIDYNLKRNKFCSSSCSAIYNNSKRAPRSQESRDKTSRALAGIKRINQPAQTYLNKFSKIQWNTCGCCNKLFYTKTWSSPRKSCGAVECKTHLSVGNRTYTNGRRKLFYYFNKHQNKTVLLESTWENNLALWLDENNIVWERPLYIKWYDESTQKERLYYPDFYLPIFDLYLDPKNPTAMKFDAYKMSQVEKLIPILYGNPEKIIQSLLSEYKDSNLGPPGPKPGALN